MTDLTSQIRVMVNKVRRFQYLVEKDISLVDEDTKKYVSEILEYHFNVAYLDFLADMIRGQREPNITTLMRIARKLGVKGYRSMLKKQLIECITKVDPIFGARLKGDRYERSTGTAKDKGVYGGTGEEGPSSLPNKVPEKSAVDQGDISKLCKSTSGEGFGSGRGVGELSSDGHTGFAGTSSVS